MFEAFILWPQNWILWDVVNDFFALIYGRIIRCAIGTVCAVSNNVECSVQRSFRLHSRKKIAKQAKTIIHLHIVITLNKYVNRILIIINSIEHSPFRCERQACVLAAKRYQSSFLHLSLFALLSFIVFLCILKRNALKTLFDTFPIYIYTVFSPSL